MRGLDAVEKLEILTNLERLVREFEKEALSSLPSYHLSVKPGLYRFIKTAINGGIKNKAKTVDKSRPPNTTIPIPRYNSEPAPGEQSTAINQKGWLVST